MKKLVFININTRTILQICFKINPIIDQVLEQEVILVDYLRLHILLVIKIFRNVIV